MEDNTRTNPGQIRENQEERTSIKENLETRVNKSTQDLDEKSSTIGNADRGRRSGLSSKDGLTGSDLDGQVTR